jgi:hypothetical protein
VKTRELKKWKKDELKEDYGRTFVKHVPKFNDFIIEPNNCKYTPVVEEFFNLYCEFPHSICDGSFPNIERLLKHIFADQYELGLRYMQILYLFPKQILPILVLTSKDRETGKTTFLNLLNIIFADNYVQISPQDLISQFNSIYATKNIIGIDETVVEKQSTVEKLKSIVTQKTITVNDKFISQYSVPFFGKVVIATNRERDFMRIDEEEIRFWVRKVPTISEKITDIENKMMQEVPAFLNYLATMPAVDFSKDRMVFTKEEIKTTYLQEVVEESRSSLYKELEILITEHFYQNNFDEFYATPSDIKNKWFHHNNQITANYIGKVIKEELKQSPSPVCRYAPFYGKYDANSPDGLKLDKKVGAPFTFSRDFFVKNGVKTDQLIHEPDPF